MKRNLVTRSWEGWQQQMLDSKIKGVRSIGIISTPIVWPVKQRPASSEKSTTSKIPINFWLMTTPSIWTSSLNHRITTMVSTEGEAIKESRSTSTVLSNHILAILKNVSSKSSLFFGEEDEFSRMETAGSGSEDEWHNLSMMEPDNISSSRTQFSNTKNIDINHTWWPQWFLHNFDNFTPPLNSNNVVKYSNEYSKKTSEYFYRDHASGNHDNNTEQTSEERNNTASTLPFLMNDSYMLSPVVTPTEVFKSERTNNKGLERFYGFQTPSSYWTYGMKNTEEAKYVQQDVSVSTESPSDAQSTQPSHLAPSLLRNEVMDSIYEQSILFTDSASCDPVSSCALVLNILPTQSKLSLGSLLAHRANMHHVSINNMKDSMYPTLLPTRTANHEESHSTVINLDGKSLDKITINSPETKKTGILNSREEEQYHLMTSSYDVSDDQWKSFVLKYEKPSENIKLYMADPTTELPFGTSSTEIVRSHPTVEINEYQKHVDAVEFSGEDDFLEDEKLYLVSRSHIVESTHAIEGLSHMNTAFNLVPTMTLSNYLLSTSIVQAVGNDSFKSNITSSSHLDIRNLEDTTQLKVERTLDEIGLSTSIDDHSLQQSFGSQKSSDEFKNMKLVPCTIQVGMNPEQQHPEFIKPQGTLHSIDITFQAREISILTASNGINDHSYKQNNFLNKDDSLEIRYNTYMATPPLAYNLLSTMFETHLMSNGQQLSTSWLPSLHTKTQSDVNAAQISHLTTSSIINNVWNYWKITTSPDNRGKSIDFMGNTQTEVLTSMDNEHLSESFATLGFSDSKLTDLIEENSLVPGTGFSHQPTHQEDYFNNFSQKLVSNGSFEAITVAPPDLPCSCSHLSDVTCFCGQEVNGSM